MTAIGALNNRFDKVDDRLEKVEVELKEVKEGLKKIEHWIPYEANGDIAANLARITGRN
ncbi:hypothetical protein [Chitinophaga sp. sic0106]|uniref:hypothetical protein n=1 Tax=Chitinophaga sp. sic0106 TaxID=2854785 RepID=UPI001C46D387|nr:hypothetical protein [Chitinophaga sp. sic0106]MBV7533849.1 hypothetical protein [Chitinophaga sp. sic0106]